MSKTLILAVAVPMLLAAQDRPNVLFFFTDDQRADTIAALGNPHIQTPVLDSLVERGYVFNNNYCFGSNEGAVCLPSRNMLLSGRVYFRHEGKVGGRDTRNYASGDKANFADSMKSLGYETYHHGKIGNVAKLIHKKFDHTAYVNHHEERITGEPGKKIVDDAIDFVKNRDASRPFFLYLAVSVPHDPRVALDKYMKLYEREKIPLPKNYLPQLGFDNGEMIVRDETLAPWPRTKDEVRKHLHDYYAVITAMDGHLGRLLDSVDLANTIVIFSSDHGLAVGSHGLFGKQSVYEHSMKAPLILAGPGVPKGRSDAFVYLHDIYPSVVDLLGGTIPDGLDGKSFVPVMKGQTSSTRDSVFLAYKDSQRAVRQGDYKLIRFPRIDKTQLFDLGRDPHEINDLSGDSNQRRRIDELTAVMKRWQGEVGDSQPLQVASPKPAAFVPPTGETLNTLLDRWRGVN